MNVHPLGIFRCFVYFATRGGMGVQYVLYGNVLPPARRMTSVLERHRITCLLDMHALCCVGSPARAV